MTPYEYTEPGNENRLSIWSASRSGEALVRVYDGDTATVAVPASEVPAAALALYEAAGLPVPVILTRPEYTGGIEHAGRTDRYAYTSRVGPRVAIGWRSIQPEELDPDEALEFAAHIAVNAHAAMRAEPDLAAVDHLADFIGGGFDLENSRSLARKILLAGWKREPAQ